MTSGIPIQLSRRLEEGGASHFGIRTPGKYTPTSFLDRYAPGFHQIRKGTTGALDRWDNAVRAARLEQVDNQFPKMTEYEKLDRVNQDIGAYNLKPHYVKLLEGIGGNFPQWHNYIVPTIVARAALRQPGRVERLARVEQLANDSFLGNAPYRVTPGGPTDEAANAIADAARLTLGRSPATLQARRRLACSRC